MTKQANDVLNALIKLTDGTDAPLVFDISPPAISVANGPLSSRSYDYSQYAGEINSIFSELVADGFLVHRGNIYFLSQKALHPHQYSWITTKRFLINSVFVPVIVSVITALIVSWLASR